MHSPVAAVRLESEDFACEALVVSALEGREEISRFFSFVVELSALPGKEAPLLQTAELIGARAALVFLDEAGMELRRVRGVVGRGTRRFYDEAMTLAHYQLEIVPALWRSTLLRTQEIFMDTTVPDIVEEKLRRLKLEGRLVRRLEHDYPPREFVVQFGETDHAFISRQLEHLGISFFFELDDDGDDVMVITDHMSAWPHLEPAPQVRGRGDQHGVTELATTTNAVPRTYVVSDYNYRTPEVDLAAVQRVAGGLLGGVVEYGTHHKTTDEGELLARRRAEELAAAHTVVTGKSTLCTFSAGTTFAPDGHPDFDGDKLLLVAVEHRFAGEVDGDGKERPPHYENRFRAVPTATTYRPPRVTPRPRIHGVISGMVQLRPNGDPGGRAQVDEHGRYTVQFHFDTAAPDETKASRPVRMAQPFVTAGNQGMHFPLTPGTEVLLAFVDGDPDRPIIVGAVPNMSSPSPVTAANANLHQLTTGGVSLQFGKR